MKSSLVYFYVQKNESLSEIGRIPFDVTRLNIGEAIDASSGIFTAPRNGIYSFHFSGVSFHSESSSKIDVDVCLILNNMIIGRSLTETNSDNSLYTQSLHSTLELKTGDQVWMSICYISPGGYLFGSNVHTTHFTGYLLQENVARNLNL